MANCQDAAEYHQSRRVRNFPTEASRDSHVHHRWRKIIRQCGIVVMKLHWHGRENEFPWDSAMLLDHVADHADALAVDTGELLGKRQPARANRRNEEFAELKFGNPGVRRETRLTATGTVALPRKCFGRVVGARDKKGCRHCNK